VSSTDPWRRLPGALVPFDWTAFAEKHRVVYRELGGLRAVFGPLALRLGLFAVGQIAWALDEIIDPRWRNAPLGGPLFILGHQRSGTTFLHRLLAGDKTHARSLLLHEMFLPAGSVQNALARLGSWDARRGSKLAKRFAAKQDALFGPLDHIHRLRFDEVEEDEFVLWAIYASGMCVNDSPISTGHRGLDFLRHFDDWPEIRRARALNWHRACLLKKAYREPGLTPDTPIWGVSKNPAFSQKVPALRRVFPDARFIYLVRNPLETIPSRLSLIRSIWRHRFPGFDQMSPDQVDTIVADSVRTYLHAERDLADVPAAAKFVLPYRDFTADPSASVRAIYERFELAAPDVHLSATLEELAARPRPHASTHAYRLDEFHLTEKDLRQRLAQVFERYDFA
jgi:omega-hydroxy-beta-dihydromenaquinone-9 sulfotransferase